MENTLKNTSVHATRRIAIGARRTGRKSYQTSPLSPSLAEADDGQNTATIAHGVDYVSLNRETRQNRDRVVCRRACSMHESFYRPTCSRALRWRVLVPANTTRARDSNDCPSTPIPDRLRHATTDEHQRNVHMPRHYDSTENILLLAEEFHVITLCIRYRVVSVSCSTFGNYPRVLKT